MMVGRNETTRRGSTLLDVINDLNHPFNHPFNLPFNLPNLVFIYIFTRTLYYQEYFVLSCSLKYANATL